MISRRLLLAAPAVLAAATARAAWPEKPIRLIVPVAPGGSQDVFARLLARGIGEQLGQNIVVENRPGAGGNLAYEAVARERADGYTLLAGADPLSINPALFARAGFDAKRDFTPVVEGVRVAQIIVVRADSRVAGLAELVETAMRGPVSVGTPGNGSLAHLIVAQLGATTGARFTHVPYRGGAPAVNDLLAGTLDAVTINIGAVAEAVRAGQLRGLAVSAPARSTTLPEVPTLAELNLSELTAVGWHGIVAPAGLDHAIVARLNAAARAALREPGLRARLAGLGLEPVDEPAVSLGERIAADAARWAPVVRALAIRAD
jgi:tripartite-type tricarboxylate transporter receptor subunit TctC